MQVTKKHAAYLTMPANPKSLPEQVQTQDRFESASCRTKSRGNKNWGAKLSAVAAGASAMSAPLAARAALVPSGAICYPWASLDVQNTTYGVMACGQVGVGSWPQAPLSTLLGHANITAALHFAQNLRICAQASNAAVTRGSQDTPVFMGLIPGPSPRNTYDGYTAVAYTSPAPSGDVFNCIADQVQNAYGS